jgi:FAD/FMN-containing dehydrogenase
MDDTIIAKFTAALSGPEAVVTEPATLTERGRDYWGFGGKPGVLLCPRTRDELVAVVRIAGQHHVPLVTRGGASNCAGAMMPNPDRALIDLSAMNRVLDIDPIARTARVQPGVINYALQQQLAPHGLCFSPDPVSAHLATVGGNIIENACGPHALKYGVTYNHVVEIEAVLADGTVIHLSADDDGPDLLGVLIGSEGTLAILTEATVALRPIAPVTRSLMGSFATARDAGDTVAAIIKTGTVPAALEWLDHTGIVGLQKYADTGYPTDAAAILLIDIDGTAEQVDRDIELVEHVVRSPPWTCAAQMTRRLAPSCGMGACTPPTSWCAAAKGFSSAMSRCPANTSPTCKKPSKPPPPATRMGCCSSWCAAMLETATCTPLLSSTATTRKLRPRWRRPTTKSSTPRCAWAAPSPVSTESAPRNVNS